MSRVFGAKSLSALSTVHPLLVQIATEALQVSPYDFTVLQGGRSKEDQEKAFNEGRSKVHYGDSAHTAFDPVTHKPRACGIDVNPYPFTNYEDPTLKAKWQAIFEAFKAVGAKHGVKLRWGGDWNGDGSTADGWDFPHIELHPWREYAAKA